MDYKIILFASLILNSFSSTAQFGSDIKDHFSDSIVSAYLLKLYPDSADNILKKTRHYEYLSFSLPINQKADTIKIFNFGANNAHAPSLMLLLAITSNSISDQLLGQKSLEIDLGAIKKFFLLFPDIKEKYKLEILDIWLQSRKGIIKTDCYIH